MRKTYIKNLLSINKKAFQFLHDVEGFDFEKPYFITEQPGKFTANTVKKAIAEHLNPAACKISVFVVPTASRCLRDLYFATLRLDKFSACRRDGVSYWNYRTAAPGLNIDYCFAVGVRQCNGGGCLCLSGAQFCYFNSCIVCTSYHCGAHNLGFSGVVLPCVKLVNFCFPVNSSGSGVVRSVCIIPSHNFLILHFLNVSIYPAEPGRMIRRRPSYSAQWSNLSFISSISELIRSILA
jgi:hypothetical protein